MMTVPLNKPRLSWLSLMLSFVLSASVLIGGCAADQEERDTDNNDPTLVQTAYGPVQGIQEDGIIAFKGIPYAAPPLDELRFVPPQKPSSWEDPLLCQEFRDDALQVSDDSSTGVIGSEDCLYLNIWKPADPSTQNLPVYVYIHGGAYAMGSPAKDTYDGTRFAQDGIIQVNIAYRLNGLGFLALEEIEDEHGYLGNMGTLDQIMALTWVKENIASFGGDPDNITIGGESAGSFSVSNLIMSPLAEGLFNRAIMESGNILGQPVSLPGQPGDRQTALEATRSFMESLGVNTLEELRALPATDIVKASYFNLDMTNPSPYYFWPVFDGVVLPENPYEALIAGQANNVDILAGFNTDEGSMFIPAGTSDQAYLDYVARVFGDNAPTVLARYPIDENNSPTDRARYYFKTGLHMGSEIFADELSRQGNSAYYYEFTFTTDELKAIDYGAGHALELYFVFDTFPSSISLKEDQEALKELIHGYWLNFIISGDPNGKDDATSADIWTPYATEKNINILNIDSHMDTVKDSDDIEFFKGLFWKERP